MKLVVTILKVENPGTPATALCTLEHKATVMGSTWSIQSRVPVHQQTWEAEQAASADPKPWPPKAGDTFPVTFDLSAVTRTG